MIDRIFNDRNRSLYNIRKYDLLRGRSLIWEGECNPLVGLLVVTKIKRIGEWFDKIKS